MRERPETNSLTLSKQESITHTRQYRIAYKQSFQVQMLTFQFRQVICAFALLRQKTRKVAKEGAIRQRKKTGVIIIVQIFALFHMKVASLV